MREKLLQRKKGGLINNLVTGVGGLVILTIIVLVILSTIIAADLVSTRDGTDSQNATAALPQGLTDNLTDGIGEVSDKIPTILLIAAVVLLFGVLILLVAQSKRMGIGSDGGSL